MRVPSATKPTEQSPVPVAIAEPIPSLPPCPISVVVHYAAEFVLVEANLNGTLADFRLVLEQAFDVCFVV